MFFRVGRNRSLAEDLTSEIFLKALEKFDTFDSETASFQSWIYSIAHNHLIDHYRLARSETSLEEIRETPGEAIDWGAALDTKKQVELISKKIADLPDAYAEIITLKYINELSNREISKVLNKSAVGVRVTLHRALNALREKMNS